MNSLSYMEIFKPLLEEEMKAKGKTDAEIRHDLYLMKAKEELRQRREAEKTFRQYLKENSLWNAVVYGEESDEDNESRT